ncbi:MAG: XTP/dITP diphosphatase [Candidatus Altiarchaeota archaeon]
MEILFATSNRHKVDEANDISGRYGITFRQADVGYPEIRDDSVLRIAEEGVKHAHTKLNKPVIVEDSGLFIESLNGFPGPYSSFVFKKIGNHGILRLMKGIEDRKATFISAVAYTDGRESRVFDGSAGGVITEDIRGRDGFGYDPIFKPEGHDKTFAEDPQHKSLASHRRKAVERLCEFLK